MRILSRLTEALGKYVKVDPNSVGERVLIAMDFRIQSAPDIRKELEKPDSYDHSG
jgi:hypothetical protein